MSPVPSQVFQRSHNPVWRAARHPSARGWPREDTLHQITTLSSSAASASLLGTKAQLQVKNSCYPRALGSPQKHPRPTSPGSYPCGHHWWDKLVTAGPEARPRKSRAPHGVRDRLRDPGVLRSLTNPPQIGAGQGGALETFPFTAPYGLFKPPGPGAAAAKPGTGASVPALPPGGELVHRAPTGLQQPQGVRTGRKMFFSMDTEG